MPSLNKEYYLLLMNVVNSTGLHGKDFSDRMNLVKEKLILMNEQYSETIVLPLSVNYGDEIAGMFDSPIHFYNIVYSVRSLLLPLTTIRFVAVRGKIAVDSPDIRQVGGQIFKTASSHMLTLKSENGFCSWHLGQPMMDKVLDSLCELSNAVIIEMSDYQRAVFELLMVGLTQKQIADRLGKYAQSVWNTIRRSKAESLVRASSTINTILQENEWKEVYNV